MIVTILRILGKTTYYEPIANRGKHDDCALPQHYQPLQLIHGVGLCAIIRHPFQIITVYKLTIVISSIMPPQDPVRAFTPEVRRAFEAYLNEISKSGKALMSATKRAQ